MTRRNPRYWRDYARMRHYVRNIATTDQLARHLLDRRIQAIKLQYSLKKKVENERRAGARIEELKVENVELQCRLERIRDVATGVQFHSDPMRFATAISEIAEMADYDR